MPRLRIWTPPGPRPHGEGGEDRVQHTGKDTLVKGERLHLTGICDAGGAIQALGTRDWALREAKTAEKAGN